MDRLIYDYDLPELSELVASWGEPSYRSAQLWEGIYRQLWTSPDEFTNLPQPMRQRLVDQFCTIPQIIPVNTLNPTLVSDTPKQSHPSLTYLAPITTLSSSDGETIKTLFRLVDGQTIETVLMRYARRRTLCISTQVGCAMGCTFCATGQMGFRRHLTSGEIIEQVLFYARNLAAHSEQVTNIVVMGMGEPFHNYVSTMAAIDRLNHPYGFNLGARRFTISTVGLVPLIHRFTAEHRQINLAVSLHAADDELRTSMLPINRKYPLEELLAACREYVKMTRRRITFEWALIRDVNDTPEQANKLAQRIKGLLCHVNVIPLNPTHSYSGKATTRQRALTFQAELERHGIPCTIRLRRGVEIQAGCGQLASMS
jgi:23S rRNA (adenine2503-C2)-methyltransferase